ncbi:helix-turn-helix domain-containing protein [Serratia fonticola]|jgi:phage repressor protein C with HTH and peptisase S24 domain|uniref:S24 family peptidase n=1 Tax=Serratia fonticola TaxID=47917 RepID=UPI002096CCA9|nr:S24 family peptidase [Serratia fonticola]MCO7511389.1 helix-turn-helix domain-containing protein [Serratia fonticola]
MHHTTDQAISNINHLMQKNGIATVADLAKLIRIPQPTFHRLMSGENQDPKYTLLKRVADHFKITVSDLVEKDLRVAATNNGNVIGQAEDVAFTKIPVMGSAQLGSQGHWVSLDNGDGFVSWPSADPEAFALRCTGDSMKPRIKDGEYVVIEPNHGYLPGDEVLLVTKDEQVMIKTFLYERDGAVLVMSVNEEHPPLRFPINDVERIQYVAGIAKPSLHGTY